MPDTEHRNPPSLDESSLVPTSEIVHVEPDSSTPQDAYAEQLIIFQTASPSGPVSRFVEQIKGHNQLVLGAVIGILATLFLGQFNNAASSPTALRPIALGQYLRLSPNGLSKWQTGADLTPTPIEIPPPPVAAAPKTAPQLQYVDRFYFAPNGGSSGEIATKPTWFMVDRFYFAGHSTAQETPPATNGALNSAFTDPGLQVLSPPESNWYPPGFSNPGSLVVPPPPDMPLAAGVQNTPYAAYSGLSPASPQVNQRRHTLLGVVETNRFGAALIRTDDGSYSVRVGDTLRQSRYVLSGLESDKAIFSDGQNTFVVNVGEKF